MFEAAYRCAEASRARDEPLFGTASYVRRWLLLEEPGAWGPNALLDSKLSRRFVIELQARTRAAGVRIVLIRRGVRPSGPGRACFFARVDSDRTYLSELILDAPEDVLDVDLMPLREGGTVAGASERLEPVFLLCTHGRHDACCSIRGNQVSRVACAEPGLAAWECSHIGGDRFAANVVSFPTGVYYGRVEPDAVTSLMHDLQAGVISLEHYRGRCCHPFDIQAAEYFVRRAGDRSRVADVLLARAARGPGGAVAEFALADGGRARVEVAVTRGPQRYRLTCGSEEERAIPRYELVSCTLGAA